VLNKKKKSTRRYLSKIWTWEVCALTVPKHLVRDRKMKGVEIYTDLLSEFGKDRTYWTILHWVTSLPIPEWRDNKIQSSTGQEARLPTKDNKNIKTKSYPVRRKKLFFCGAKAQIQLRPHMCLDRIHLDTHAVGLLCMNDQLVVEAGTDTTHNRHKRQTSMPSAGFETSVPTIKRLQTYVLDRMETGINLHKTLLVCLRRQMRRKIWYRDFTSGFSLRQIFFSFRITSEEFLVLTHIETVKCPNCSPDLATGDKCLFPRLKSFCARNPFWVRGTWNAVGRSAKTASPHLPKRRNKRIEECIRAFWGYCELFNL
jgi:hypothetical protein